MEDNDSAAEKRTAVDYLSFGAKTAKRVTWEAWEFTVVGPHLVEVTNASYGFEKDDHTYAVGVEERGGLAVPAECDCPADKYREDYDCKHKVALATVGGPTVLKAAVNYENPTPASSDADSMTAADKLRADGGNPDQREGECRCVSDSRVGSAIGRDGVAFPSRLETPLAGNTESTGRHLRQYYVVRRMMIDCMFSERFRQGVLPFLLFAYPVTFLFFRGGQYCEPLCFEPTPIAVFELGVVLLGLMVVSGIGTAVFRFDTQGKKPVRWLLSPTPVASVVLLGVFTLFVIFLALDAMTVYEAVWKPFILPLSFLLFLPVWVVYMLSFPLAILLSIFGIDSPTVGTLAFLGVLIAIGFPLSALFQTFAISAIVDGFRSKSE